MILVDSSVWIDHFRKENNELSELLAIRSQNTEREIISHPYIVGEIVLGSIPSRNLTLKLVDSLRSVKIASISQFRSFVEDRKLYSAGLNFVDCHVLLATKLSPNTKLWTFDKRLADKAYSMSILYTNK